MLIGRLNRAKNFELWIREMKYEATHSNWSFAAIQIGFLDNQEPQARWFKSICCRIQNVLAIMKILTMARSVRIH
jgi:hypothetical protein